MRNFVIYEHIYGLCEFLDTIMEELTEYAMENCRTVKEVEDYIKIINKIQPTDKYGRKRNLYVYWCN
jgi:hypothetical protein